MRSLSNLAQQHASCSGRSAECPHARASHWLPCRPQPAKLGSASLHTIPKLRSVLVSARQKGSRTRRLVFAEVGEDEDEDAADAEDGAAEDEDVSLDGIGGIMEEDDPPGHKSGERLLGHSLRSTLQCVTLQCVSKQGHKFCRSSITLHQLRVVAL